MRLEITMVVATIHLLETMAIPGKRTSPVGLTAMTWNIALDETEHLHHQNIDPDEKAALTNPVPHRRIPHPEPGTLHRLLPPAATKIKSVIAGPDHQSALTNET